MEVQFLFGLAYSAGGLAVAALALHASMGLGRQLRALRVASARLHRELPHYTALYFHSTSRALFWTASAFLAGVASDAVLSVLAPSEFAARFLGYGGALFLLFASVLMLMQANRDRRLGLHSRLWRLAYIIGAAAGVAISVGGKLLVVEFGGIWP